MKQDALIYTVNYKYGDEIKIKPLMDLHKGAKTCDKKAFKEYIKDRDEKTYFLTNGDLWDMIFFNDKRFRPSGHDLTDSDDAIDQEIDEMAHDLDEIKDRIIAIGTGNHEDTVTKLCHTNPSKRLADKLGVPYMGYSWWLRLSLTEDGSRGRTVDFFLTHGFGGGTRTEGGSITKYSRFADRFLCDVMIVGHDHRLQYVKYPVLGIRGDKVAQLYGKSKAIVLGGSWKKTYGTGTSVSWEETKGFPAVHLGGAVIHVKPNNKWVDINVSM
jgi:UDP-2,3-diacylglucosamine pyrophosphatase LpxH